MLRESHPSADFSDVRLRSGPIHRANEHFVFHTSTAAFGLRPVFIALATRCVSHLLPDVFSADVVRETISYSINQNELNFTS